VTVSIAGLLFTKAVRGWAGACKPTLGVFDSPGAPSFLVLAWRPGSSPKEPFWREAKLALPLETAAIAVKPYLPPALADKVRYER
jgi:hypothetical protein